MAERADSRARVYLLGNFTVDDIVLHGSRVSWDLPGGNVLYAASGVRTWLREVGILARLGSDYPEQYLGVLRERGYVLALRSVDAPIMHTWALYERGSAHRFVHHIGSGGHYDMSIRPDEIDASHRGAEAYHIAPMPTDIQLGLARALKTTVNLVSLDPHVDYARRGDAALEQILGIVDCFLPSQDEARLAYGSDSPEAAARSFAAAGPRAVAIKLAEEGSVVFDRAGDRLVHVPAVAVNVVDVTGAGDAYCGGFIAGMLLTQDPIEAALYATVAASYTVESHGALAPGPPAPAHARARLDDLRGRLSAGGHERRSDRSEDEPE